jgi:hypothetical protein
MAIFGGGGGIFGQSQRGYQITPEEEEDLLSSLGRAGLSSLAYIGESIDKPMAALRGLLAGRPEELANIIPFSDALGITSSDGMFGGTSLQVTDDEDTVYGRDLLEQWGIASDNVDGLGGSDWSDIDIGDAASDMAGFAIDMLGVPMAGPANALSKAGKLSQMAGLTDEAAKIAALSGTGATKFRVTNTLDDALETVTGFAGNNRTREELMGKLYLAGEKKYGMAAQQVDELLGQNLGSTMKFGGVSLPRAADEFVATGVDDLARKLGRTGLGKLAKQGFAPVVAGTGTTVGQEYMGPLLNINRDAGDKLARENIGQYAATVYRNRATLGRLGNGDEVSGLYRAVELDMDELSNWPGLEPGDIEKINEVRFVKQSTGDMAARAKAEGVNFAELQDKYIDYHARGELGRQQNILEGQSKMFNAVDPSTELGRQDYLKNWPGGTATLRDIAQQTAGGGAEDVAALAASKLQPEVDSLTQQLADLVTQRKTLDAERREMAGIERNALKESQRPERQLRSLQLQRERQLERMAELHPVELEPADITLWKMGKMQQRADELRARIDQASVMQPAEMGAESAAASARQLELNQLLEGVAERSGKLRGELKATQAKPEALGSYYGGLEQKLREAGVFGDPVGMAKRRAEAFEDAIANARTTTDTLADFVSGGRTRELTDVGEPGLMSKLGKALGFKQPDPESNRMTIGAVLNSLGMDGKGAADAIRRKMTDGGRDLIDKTAGVVGAADSPDNLEALRKALLNQTVPNDMANDFGRLKKTMQGPDPTSLLKDGAIQYNRLWKGLQTNPWVNFHMRNLGSGQVREVLAGNNPTGELDMVRRLMSGGQVGADEAMSVPGVRELMQSQGLGEEESANALRQLLYKYMPTEGQGMSLEDIGGRFSGMSDASGLGTDLGFAGGLNGSNPVGFRAAINELAPLVSKKARAESPEWYKPAALRGIAGRDKTAFTFSAAGEKLGEGVEGLNRIPSWINQVKNGIDPEQAARNVNKTQIDYSTRAFTPFENEIRRLGVMPFYSFSSRNIPYTAGELLNNPTGRTGTLFKGLSRLRSDDEFLPEHIAQTLAIPLGQSDEGDPRYLTGLGLMEEDLLGAINTSDPLKAVGYEVMGRLSPLLKAPIEYVLGKSLFQSGYQGPRDTEDMDPQLGRLMSNIVGAVTGEDQRNAVDTRSIEPLLQMFPGIRAISNLRQVTDGRKYDHLGVPLLMNQLTGSRIADVSTSAQDASLMDMIANEYKGMGGRDFSNYYIPDSVQEGMSPEEINHLKLLRALQSARDRRRRERQAAYQ